MDNWLKEINQKLNALRGLFMAHEESLIELTFNDGHADHVTNLAELRQAAQAVAQKLADANQENGDIPQIKQEIVQLFAIVANSRRLWAWEVR